MYTIVYENYHDTIWWPHDSLFFKKAYCLAYLREVRFKKDNFLHTLVIANSVEFDLRHVREFRKILPTVLKAIFKFFLKSKHLK